MSDTPAPATPTVTASLSSLAAQIEGFATGILQKGEAEVQTLVNDAVQVAEEAVPVVENLLVVGFEQAVAQFGPLASALVTSLMGAAGAGLLGNEKANLSATQLVQAAANQGVVLADQDVTTLIKNSYIAVSNLVTKAVGGTPALTVAPAAT
jgi:hypothetical protein